MLFRSTQGELLEIFFISEDVSDFSFQVELDHFAIVTLLHYMQGRDRYAALRRAVEKHCVGRVGALSRGSSERVLIVLDLVSCPYVSTATKRQLLGLFGVKDNAHRDEIVALRSRWFVCWQSFSLGAELDSKRSRDVY